MASLTIDLIGQGAVLAGDGTQPYVQGIEPSSDNVAGAYRNACCERGAGQCRCLSHCWTEQR